MFQRSLYWWYKVVRTPTFPDPLLQDFEPRSQFLKLAGNPVLSMPDTEREKGVLIRYFDDVYPRDGSFISCLACITNSGR